MIRRKLTLAVISALALGSLSSSARANTHITNGQFDSNEWTLSATNGALASTTIADQAFAPNGVTNRGGAVLYVEQSTNGVGGLNRLGTTLNLMYDYVNSPVALPGSTLANSSVDVFFEVPSDADYVVHITSTGFVAFEKLNGAVSPENPNGTLLFETPGGTAVGPWSALQPGDPALTEMHTALQLTTSPNSITPHLVAEFDLTINDTKGSAAGGTGHSGVYDPAPAFWSASGKDTTSDPVMSSEMFTLQYDGSVLTSPVLNSLGDPVAQPSDVPEPASLTLLTAGVGTTLFRRKRRI